jgi:glycosyltransferase involved in cell wall biosynthesis
MRLLWIRREALDPIRGGGHIRTVNVMRQLARRHSIDLLSFADGTGPSSAPPELPTVRVLGVSVATRGSRGWRSTLLPGMVASNHSVAMRDLIAGIHRQYDKVVVDSLHVALNVPDLTNAILCQHNVETSLLYRSLPYRRGRRDQLMMAADIARLYFYERRICRSVRHVWAVSAEDQALMRSLFGVTRVTNTGTGVDAAWFGRPATTAPVADLVFVGSMNWAPNADGVRFFVRQVLPIIRQSIPGCTLALVGRDPDGSVVRAAQDDPAISVTGTVPDVRPYLWGARVAVVPLRIGGGTRIKIFEAMAAGCPVVSTSIGCEGLGLTAGRHLLVGDDPGEFAALCIRMLADRAAAAELAAVAREFVASECTWERVAARCEIALNAA